MIDHTIVDVQLYLRIILFRYVKGILLTKFKFVSNEVC